MKVAVIGANGQLGSDLAVSKPAGVELCPFTRRDFDVTDAAAVTRALETARPDAVINTAAFHKTDLCEDDPVTSFLVNAVAVRDLARTVRKMNGVLLHVSTDYVFDGKNRETPYLETDTPNPINTYGVSKLAGETFLRNFTERHYIVRTASLFGLAGASGKGGNFVTAIQKKAREGGAVKVIRDIQMSPTYTRDAAEEIWKILMEKRSYGVYHVANAGVCSWFDFAKKIIELSKISCDVVGVPHTEYPSKAERPLWSPLASGRGVRLRPWQDALAHFIGAQGK